MHLAKSRVIILLSNKRNGIADFSQLRCSDFQILTNVESELWVVKLSHIGVANREVEGGEMASVGACGSQLITATLRQ